METAGRIVNGKVHHFFSPQRLLDWLVFLFGHSWFPEDESPPWWTVFCGWKDTSASSAVVVVWCELEGVKETFQPFVQSY